eukprot:COSAG06_NODE_31356_length_523_cov_0.601415_1_plen_156_part_10
MLTANITLDRGVAVIAHALATAHAVNHWLTVFAQVFVTFDAPADRSAVVTQILVAAGAGLNICVTSLLYVASAPAAVQAVIVPTCRASNGVTALADWRLLRAWRTEVLPIAAEESRTRASRTERKLIHQRWSSDLQIDVAQQTGLPLLEGVVFSV